MRHSISRVTVAVAVALSAGLSTVPAYAGSAGYVTPVHVPYYVVPTSTTAAEQNQMGLFFIAQQLLGAGNQFTAIFALNENRVQPGGAKLTDPSALDPGWYLVLPCNASGSFAGVSVQWNPPPDDVPPNQVTETCPADVGPPATPVPIAASGPRPAAQAGSATAPASSSGFGGVELWLLLGLAVLILIGAGLAIRRRLRRPATAQVEKRKEETTPPKRPGQEKPPRPRRSLHPRWPAFPRRRRQPVEILSWSAAHEAMDCAVSALAQAGRGGSWWPYAAVVSADDVTIWLAGVDVPEPEEPWQPVEDDPRAWQVARADLPDGADDSQAGAICPVALGMLDESVVVLDVSQSYGALGIGGDQPTAERVRESIAGQLEGGEVIVRAPGADPLAGRTHWSVTVDAEGSVSVFGRRFDFVQPGGDAAAASPPTARIAVGKVLSPVAADAQDLAEGPAAPRAQLPETRIRTGDGATAANAAVSATAPSAEAVPGTSSSTPSPAPAWGNAAISSDSTP